MARVGIYKSDVQQARKALLAQGKHPSVDAVRIALGNTGSKTTIHRFLKELEEESGPTGSKASISNALQDLVARLADRLHDEADAKIEAVRIEQVERDRRHADEVAMANKEIHELTALLKRTESALAAEQDAHASTREVLQQETVARHTAVQHVADLKERLAENEEHRKSLEDKHRHAREALEHYRQSVKEQREQDQRLHEHQVQQLQAELRIVQQTVILRQEEVTRLNHEGAGLVSDLSHSKKALYDAQMQIQRMEQKLEVLQGAEHRAALLGMQLQEREQQVAALQAQLAAASATSENYMSQIRTLELDLASLQAKLGMQQELVRELRTNLNAVFLARKQELKDSEGSQPT